MIPNTALLPELNPTQRLLSIIESNLKYCQDNKEVYWCRPRRAKISMKPIQIPFLPIEPCEYLDHNKVVTLTLKCIRWNIINEKLISPRFYIIDSVIIDDLPNFRSVLIILIKCELITCQMFVLFWFYWFSNNW